MPGENVLDWSTTAANNDDADSSINWLEGQARSTVNNSARSMMAALAKHRNLNNGSITTGGTANVQTFTSGVTYTSIPTGLRVLLKVGTGLTNTGSATLNMDSIGAVTVKDRVGANLGGGEFTADSYIDLIYNGTNWIVQHQTGGIVYLSTATASASATLDFTSGISGAYGAYLFTLVNFVPATDGTNLRILVSEDAGANWKTAITDYNGAIWAVNSTPASGAANPSFFSDALTIAQGLSSTAANPLNGTVFLFQPASATTKKMFQYDLTYFSSSALYTRIAGVGAYFGTTNAINGIRFLMSAGNLTTGTVQMFGIR